MARRILVTGASGTLGRNLVPRLVAAGHQVRALSRQPRVSTDERIEWVVGDLRGGSAGVAEAVGSMDIIVHCASARRGDGVAARHLLDAARSAGSPHLVYISIAGIHRVPLGYYQTKLEVEVLIADSGMPFTILRATQFHDLILRLFTAQRRLPLLAVPAGFSFQPVDAGEVADRLTGLADAAPAGRVPDLGGPEVLGVVDLARQYLGATGRHRPVLPVRVPGAIGRTFRGGANLAVEHADGKTTFRQFLTTRTDLRQ